MLRIKSAQYDGGAAIDKAVADDRAMGVDQSAKERTGESPLSLWGILVTENGSRTRSRIADINFSSQNQAMSYFRRHSEDIIDEGFVEVFTANADGDFYELVWEQQ